MQRKRRTLLAARTRCAAASRPPHDAAFSRHPSARVQRRSRGTRGVAARDAPADQAGVEVRDATKWPGDKRRRRAPCSRDQAGVEVRYATTWPGDKRRRRARCTGGPSRRRSARCSRGTRGVAARDAPADQAGVEVRDATKWPGGGASPRAMQPRDEPASLRAMRCRVRGRAHKRTQPGPTTTRLGAVVDVDVAAWPKLSANRTAVRGRRGVLACLSWTAFAFQGRRW